MTRVDFYIVQGGDTALPLVACRLTEKAYRHGHRVYIHTRDVTQAQRLDTLLWTFRAGSFVPHALAETPCEDTTPVFIGADEPAEGLSDVLINLSTDLPLFFSRFERVAEVVADDERARERARERYRFYRERGYPLDTHTLDEA